MYKHKEWTPYNNRKVKIIELNLKDYNGQTVDFYKLEKNKTRDKKRILDKIKKIYGFNLGEEPKIDIKKEKGKKKSNWLSKDMNW